MVPSKQNTWQQKENLKEKEKKEGKRKKKSKPNMTEKR